MKNLGNFLREKREKNNLSVAKVASALKVKEDYILFLEKNEIYYFSQERLENISEVYKLSEDESKEFYRIVKMHG